MDWVPALALVVETWNLKIMATVENVHVLKTLALSKSKITLDLENKHTI
jgi:hypothetical protein